MICGCSAHISSFTELSDIVAIIGCGAPGCGEVWTVMVMASLSVSTRLMVAETVPRSDTLTLWCLCGECDCIK